jgi:hypothetical protein
MCDAKPSPLAMKICGNIDENISQDQNYDVDVVCATEIRGKLRRTFVAIVTGVVKYKICFRRTIIDIATMDLSFFFFFFT